MPRVFSLRRAEGREEEADVGLEAAPVPLLEIAGEALDFFFDVALDLLKRYSGIVGGLYSVTAWRENDQEGHSVY